MERVIREGRRNDHKIVTYAYIPNNTLRITGRVTREAASSLLRDILEQ